MLITRCVHGTMNEIQWNYYDNNCLLFFRVLLVLFCFFEFYVNYELCVLILGNIYYLQQKKLGYEYNKGFLGNFDLSLVNSVFPKSVLSFAKCSFEYESSKFGYEFNLITFFQQINEILN